MNLQFTIRVCTVAIGLSSLSLCQPPTPRIARIEEPSNAIATVREIIAEASLTYLDRSEQLRWKHCSGWPDPDPVETLPLRPRAERLPGQGYEGSHPSLSS